MGQEEQLKPGWKVWRFDQMAVNVNERIDDPSQADVDYYIGLEHLDPDSLKIRRWGNPSDVEATKLIFRKGDIIFGRRRVYQRKVAVADFDGICSAHALVLRSRPEVALPEFLPFFMQSNLFMERAKAISVGSLSPTINWKTLAKEVFVLPSLEEQKWFSLLLRKAEDVAETIYSAQQHLDIVLASATEELIQRTHKRTTLDLILRDTSYGCSKQSNHQGNGVPILRIPNVLRDELDLSDLQWIDLLEEEVNRYAVEDGDILLVRTNGNPAYVGRCVVARAHPKPMVFASYLIRLRVDQTQVIPDFLATLLNSPSIRRALRGDVRSSAGNFNINTKGIRRQSIPLPSLDEQNNFVEGLDQLKNSGKRLEDRVNAVTAIKKVTLADLGG